MFASGFKTQESNKKRQIADRCQVVNKKPQRVLTRAIILYVLLSKKYALSGHKHFNQFYICLTVKVSLTESQEQ